MQDPIKCAGPSGSVWRASAKGNRVENLVFATLCGLGGVVQLRLQRKIGAGAVAFHQLAQAGADNLRQVGVGPGLDLRFGKLLHGFGKVDVRHGDLLMSDSIRC